MEWNDIKYNKPTPKQEVITFNGRFMYIEEFDYCLDQDAYFSQSGSSITHWMPLPNPPHLP